MAKFDRLDKKEYPFKHNYFKTKFGNIHYVDEGKGDPIVFVHGNPYWSFGFRHLIKEFSKTNRCIALDHLGFGLSDKPKDWTYLPEDHSKNLENLLESLNIDNITLVVEDWGGPIGLSYAVRNVNNIENVIITNTRCWSVKKDLYYQLFSKFMGGFFGRWLILEFNFFVSVLVWLLYGDKKKLTKSIYNHFKKPLEYKHHRKGNYIFPKQVVDSYAWLDDTYSKLNLLKSKKVLILWGMCDIGFRKKELNKRKQVFIDANVVNLKGVGHFVCDESPQKVIKEIKEFL